MRPNPKTIVVCDDEDWGRLYLLEVLKDEAYNVIPTRNAEETLAVLKEHAVDLIVLDVLMPFMNGYELAYLLRNEGNHIPVLMYSAQFSNSETYTRMAELGNAYYLNKPCMPKMFLEKVSAILEEGPSIGPKVFVVHGRNHRVRDEVCGFLKTQGMHNPVILQNQRSEGLTIMEKFERQAHNNLDIIVCILTRDDVACSKETENDFHERARQNVIFEMGYFMGKYGRTSGKIFLLFEAPLEIPSDLAGVVYIDISRGIEQSGEEFARELSPITDYFKTIKNKT